MEYDIENPFCELYETGEQFKHDLLSAVATEYIREDIPVWSKKLQFLTVASEDAQIGHDQKLLGIHRDATGHEEKDDGEAGFATEVLNKRKRKAPTAATLKDGDAHLDAEGLERFIALKRTKLGQPPASELLLPETLARRYPHIDNSRMSCNGPQTSCSCASYRGFETLGYYIEDSNRQKVLRLTSPGEVTNCTHYLAVSYTWQQPESDSLNYEILLPTGERRKSRAPPNVLDCVIDYAAAQSIKFIWIDQECIDQDIEKEKELGVNAMDVVYNQAQQVVAVLNTKITEQIHMDVFKTAERYLLKEMSLFPEPTLRPVMQLSAFLSKDPWFSRAWTLQESLVASKLLHFLVPYEHSLERAPWLGNLTGQLVIHQLVLQAIICRLIKPYTWLVPAEGRSEQDDVRESILQSELGSIGAYHVFQETCPEHKWHHRQSRSCTALEACRLLLDRHVRDHVDRIAIMANLCGYKRRLRRSEVLHRKLGFSICALALSIINGDVSLAEEIRSEPYEGRSEAYSWLPLPEGSIKAFADSNRTMNNLFDAWVEPKITLLNQTISSSGLLATGYLYHMSCRINLHEIKSKIREAMHNLPWLSGSNNDAIKTCIMQVLKHIGDRTDPAWDTLIEAQVHQAEEFQHYRLERGPLRFLNRWHVDAYGHEMISFSESLGSTCLFTDEENPASDYVFVPSSDHMFDSHHWDHPLHLIHCAWQMSVVGQADAERGQPIRLRYVGYPDCERLFLLGHPDSLKQIEPQQVLIE